MDEVSEPGASLQEEPGIQVAVVGAVNAPGLYRVKESASVFEVITLAQGFDSTAIVTKVQILRGTQTTLIPRPQELDFPLKDGDVIYVPGKRE